MFITILEIFMLRLGMDFKFKILSLRILKKFIKYQILMKILSVKLEIIGRKQVLFKLIIITKLKSTLMTTSLSNILTFFCNILLKSNKKKLQFVNNFLIKEKKFHKLKYICIGGLGNRKETMFSFNFSQIFLEILVTDYPMKILLISH